MSLYMINISVDSDDHHPELLAEDLSFNEQESVIEMVVEQILGQEDFFQEYDDHDPEEHNKRSGNKIDVFAQQYFCALLYPSYVHLKKTAHPAYTCRLVSGFDNLESPPPRI